MSVTTISTPQDENEGTEALLTARELSERWKLTTGHLSNMRYKGTGPRYLKFGNGLVRYRLADVRDYEDSSVVESLRASA